MVWRFLLLLIVATIVFYFWGSSSTLDEKEYAQLIELDGFNVPKNDSIFSIMTYNIGYLSGMTNNRAVDKPKSLFDTNLKKVQSEIKKANPDIIVFQEIDYDASRSYHINQEESITNLGYQFTARAINWDKRYIPFPYWPPKMHFGQVVSGQSIISKYPLKNHERIVLQRVENTSFLRDAFYIERLAQVVKVTINAKEIVVINVHLEAFDRPTRVKQFEEVLAVFNQYKDKYPTILLGDFNSRARDKDAVIHQLFAMDNIGNAVFNKDYIENTFDSKKPFERIDYIFYTKKTIEYLSGEVLANFGETSDHLPVQMKFRLK